MNSAALPVVGATITATGTDDGHTRRRTRRCARAARSGSAPTLGLVTTNAAGVSTTAVPLGHWTITATCRGTEAERHASRCGVEARGVTR